MVPEGRRVNRRIRRLGVGLVALIGLLFLQVSYIQVFAAGRIAADPANARRQIIAEYKVERGQIITADGTVIALSEPTGANATLRYVRRYPEGPLFAGITGFYSQVYGRTELEQSMNTYLAGDAPELAVSTLADLVLGRPKKGGHVITTIDARLQRVAAVALGTQPGAVVAMDPRNGDVLVMVSNPTFDPNELSSQDLEEVRAAWGRLNADPRTPLLSRATTSDSRRGRRSRWSRRRPRSRRATDWQTACGRAPTSWTCRSPTARSRSSAARLPGRDHHPAHRVHELVQRDLRGEVRTGSRAGRRFRTGARVRLLPDRSARGDRVPGADDPFTIPFATGRFPIASYFEGNDPLVAISAQSNRTTTWPTRCRWRWWRPPSRTAA